MDGTQDKGIGRVCPNCGAALVNDTKYCMSCGTALEQQTQQPQPQPQYVYTESWMGSNFTSSAGGSYTNNTVSGNAVNPYPNTPGYSNNVQNGQSYPNAYGNPYGNNYQGAYQQNSVSGFAIAGLVLGILSILSCFFSVFNLLLAIPGIIFSGVAIAQSPNSKGMAVAGLSCSITGIFLGVMFMVLVLL